jgi:aspartyl-tRNA(Asn)/glutamyl-tRNA(Gln) amidotransferase subunit A
MYLGDIMTVNVNLAGFPAISVPAGLADQGNDNKKKAPVGIQFIGGPFEEAKLLGVAHTFEKTRALPLVPPEISIE